jgi:di/tricarboxylate transporter
MTLTPDQVSIGVVLGAVLGLFVWGRWRYDLVALGALLAVVFRGLVPMERAFEGFAHPAVVTVAAVLVLSKGLLNAGVVDLLARGLTRIGSRSAIHCAVLTLVVAVCSGFMNNVGALALLMPVAIWLSRQNGYSPSRLLMPLAFGSLLGGMTTLIGTPPNMIIASFRAEASGAPFGMFDFLPVGAGVLILGVAAIAALGAWLVPERVNAETKEHLFAIEEYLSEVRIPPDSKFVGETLHQLEADVPEDAEITVVGVVRGEQRRLVPSPYTVLRADDILQVEATPEDLQTFLQQSRFVLEEDRETGRKELASEEVVLREAVVFQHSALIGRSMRQVMLRNRYGVNLLAVARQGHRLRERLSRIRFVVGDILLLQGAEEALRKAIQELGCLPLAERGLGLLRSGRPWPAAAIFVAGLLATAAGLAPVQIALTTAAVAMVLAGVLTLREAYEAIDWPILVLLGAMMPVGAAFESSGAAGVLAAQVVRLSHEAGAVAVLPLLLVATMLLSNVVNNAAAAVLMAPIAMEAAHALQVSVDSLLMGVAVGASSAFLTPIGHQSNTLVMEPGGYRFSDYWRLGLPLSLLVTVAATVLIL